MSDFTIKDGFVTIEDEELFSTWQDRPDYIDAIAAADDPEVEARKRVLAFFEAELARMVNAGTVDAEVDAILDRYIGDPYVQHDPNIEDGRPALAEFFRQGGFGDTPPPPVALLAEDDLITMVLQLPEPDPMAPGSTYDRYFLSVFRIRDGRLVEHWDPMPKIGHGLSQTPSP